MVDAGGGGGGVGTDVGVGAVVSSGAGAGGPVTGGATASTSAQRFYAISHAEEIYFAEQY